MIIRLGTRASVLARWQADSIAELLQKDGHTVEIVPIRTTGDQHQTGAVAALGREGVFSHEIQQALLEKRIDLAVHSLKDLPTVPVPGLHLAATPLRGPVRDVFLSNRYAAPSELPGESRIGTGSLRRLTQFRHLYGDRFRIEDLRGNIETRLRKLDEGHYDAIILAEAALVRLGLQDRIRFLLEPPAFLPAVGQGAIGLEIRDDDAKMIEAIAPLNHAPTFAAITAERALLMTLQGGCIAPIAALAQEENGLLSLHGRILSPRGAMIFEAIRSDAAEQAEMLGIVLAETLLDSGAMAILEEIRSCRDAQRSE